MTRIFITIDWFLPGTNSGGPVRSVSNLIEALPECQFYVFTRNNDYCSTEVYSGVLSDQWIAFSENCSVFYCSEQNVSKATLEAQLKVIAPNILYINGIYSKAFSQWPLQLGTRLKFKTIVATRGMLSPHALRVKAFKKYLFLTWMRWINAYSEITFHATSEAESKDIRKILGSQVNVNVIPNLARLAESQDQEISKDSGELKLVSIGRIAPEKGTLHALNALESQLGKITLDIFGTCYNEKYWNQCLHVISQLPSNVQVNYHGSCPSDEVATHLAAAHALLLPSEGENFGHAIVEAFANSRPVVISKNTPWKDLAVQNAGWDLSNPEISTAITKLVQFDQANYNAWSEGAAAYYQNLIAPSLEANRSKYLHLFEK
jgi:glycosyltransferase involved in cell wall biosynthesis